MPFVHQDEKNQILTTNIWLNLVSVLMAQKKLHLVKIYAGMVKNVKVIEALVINTSE